MEEGLIKRLMTSLRCTECGHCYEVSGVDVLGHEEDLWFLKASCPSCHAEFLVTAVLQESKGPEIGTNITGAEAAEFHNMDKLTVDDVMDMRNFLKDFDGDFLRIFRESAY